ncbi:hypothetical protein ColLi_01089 [Colletotrichum liriopes]|uniref:Uncharacterized protein n=1 Tax=Colletotrichum liriopes TaxID=708192 RepID=A0AA37LMW8_9PEZI|nr:hypothetical protein ColLi_01089 [Colletotrichum liriopes]
MANSTWEYLLPKHPHAPSLNGSHDPAIGVRIVEKGVVRDVSLLSLGAFPAFVSLTVPQKHLDRVSQFYSGYT